MDIIAAIRDILISIYLLTGIVLVIAILIFLFLFYKAMKGLINAATRVTQNVEKISESAIEHISKPLQEGVSIGSVAGNMLGFATGFIAGMRGRKATKEDGGSEASFRRWIPFL